MGLGQLTKALEKVSGRFGLGEGLPSRPEGKPEKTGVGEQKVRELCSRLRLRPPPLFGKVFGLRT